MVLLCFWVLPGTARVEMLCRGKRITAVIASNNNLWVAISNSAGIISSSLVANE